MIWSGSVETLNVSRRCGCSFRDDQMRWTVVAPTPCARAMVRVQGVDAGGVVAVVARTIASTVSCGMVGFRPLPLRTLPRSRTPSSANRARHIGYARGRGANHCGDSIRGHTIGSKEKSFSPLDFAMRRGLRLRDGKKHGTLFGRHRQTSADIGRAAVGVRMGQAYYNNCLFSDHHCVLLLK
jgi:hypothetical protein